MQSQEKNFFILSPQEAELLKKGELPYLLRDPNIWHVQPFSPSRHGTLPGFGTVVGRAHLEYESPNLFRLLVSQP